MGSIHSISRAQRSFWRVIRHYVSAHEACWNLHRPTQSYQQVREVLADTLAHVEDLLDSRGHVSHALAILELAVDHLAHPQRGFERLHRTEWRSHARQLLERRHQWRRIERIRALHHSQSAREVGRQREWVEQ